MFSNGHTSAGTTRDDPVVYLCFVELLCCFNQSRPRVINSKQAVKFNFVGIRSPYSAQSRLASSPPTCSLYRRRILEHSIICLVQVCGYPQRSALSRRELPVFGIRSQCPAWQEIEDCTSIFTTNPRLRPHVSFSSPILHRGIRDGMPRAKWQEMKRWHAALGVML